MFESIDLSQLKKSLRFGYAEQVPFFKSRKTLAFKPGLNVLFGPNGCGKSTVLNILGQTMAATQGGISAVTENLVHDTVDMLGALSVRGKPRKKEMADKIGVPVAHDGQPVLYCDPRQTVGITGGAFDDDFFERGLDEAVNRSRASHGERAYSRASLALSVLSGKTAFPKDVVHKISKKTVNDMWGQALDVVYDRMQGSIEKGQPTVLLDEPESNYSLLWQAGLWKLLAQPSVAERFQVIVASHSPFALNIPGAHYIEFEKGYMPAIQAALQERFCAPG